MSFKLSLLETKVKTFRLPEHRGNNNLYQVLVGNANHMRLLQIQKWMGADPNVSERKSLSQGEVKTHFGFDKGTAGTTTAPALPRTSSASWVPRKCICVASKRTRSEKLFLARGRPGNSIDAEPTKLYPGG
jgi:hypothetical protein